MLKLTLKLSLETPKMRSITIFNCFNFVKNLTLVGATSAEK